MAIVPARRRCDRAGRGTRSADALAFYLLHERQSLRPAVGLSHREAIMQPTSRFEATIPTQLHALISDLRWRIQMIEADILEDERRAGISDPKNLAYPMLAQNLRARRDNIRVSIAILESRLEKRSTEWPRAA
jgi:hypothetical protein